MAGARPGGVTLVSILAWISGVLQLITGIVLLFAPDGANGAVTIAAWISIVLGIITIAVGVGLWRGSPVARIIATIVFVLNLISAVVAMFTASGSLWAALVNGLLALIGIILLWTRAASDFFRR
ncbi:MAG: hypothetical protein ABWX66_06950 [Lacisediminihabitans sp.]|uniref:Uncharacterized protein n=1 Tax=Microbacterium pygmaeum TaxID=370764 RepID=A0A1G7V1V0_9MICO|nr:hypothetical protein [Microbacterium pygmaeum]SDG53548.1 hypothetical protein SAMN04489810_0563 [Microbacterium pygmaeum]